MINRRRAVLAMGTLGAATWLRAGHAQRVYRIAVLIHGPESMMGARFEALRAGLRELGYIEGGNLALTVRWNEGSLDRLPDLAAELLRGKPDVFVGAPLLSVVAAHKHTRTVPIVLASGGGVMQVGIVESLAHPGGNVTGFVNLGEDLTSKQVQLLRTLAPGISRVGVLTTGTSLVHDENWRDAERAAMALKLELIEVRISALGDLPRLASICGNGNCQGLLVLLDPILHNWRAQIIASAAQLRLPAVYPAPEYAREGGLISYSANFEDNFRRAATYVDKILKGAKPGDLPIQQPTKFELIVNAKTAKGLGIKIPDSIRVQADTVIE